jgi:hypothetical protein
MTMDHGMQRTYKGDDTAFLTKVRNFGDECRRRSKTGSGREDKAYFDAANKALTAAKNLHVFKAQLEQANRAVDAAMEKEMAGGSWVYGPTGNLSLSCGHPHLHYIVAIS